MPQRHRDRKGAKNAIALAGNAISPVVSGSSGSGKALRAMTYKQQLAHVAPSNHTGPARGGAKPDNSRALVVRPEGPARGGAKPDNSRALVVRPEGPTRGGAKPDNSRALVVRPEGPAPAAAAPEQPSAEDLFEASNPKLAKGAEIAEVLGDIMDVREAFNAYGEADSSGEKLAAASKGGGKGVSAVQGVARLGAAEEGGVLKAVGDSWVAAGMAQGALVVSSATAIYNSFDELKDAWTSGTWGDAFEKTGELFENLGEMVSAGSAMLSNFFDTFKDWETLPLVEGLKSAVVIIQRAVGAHRAWQAWSQLATDKTGQEAIQAARAARGANRRPSSRMRRQIKKTDEVIGVEDQLIAVHYDRFKQNAFELLTAGTTLGAVAAGPVGLPALAGTKIAESAGKLYTAGLRLIREKGLPMTDQTRTQAARLALAGKLRALNNPLLWDASGVDASDRGTDQTIAVALMQPT